LLNQVLEEDHLEVQEVHQEEWVVQGEKELFT